jgi:hypothetical protein
MRREKKLDPLGGDFPILMLVATSRVPEPQLGSCTVVQPCRLERNRVSTFFEIYLAQYGKSGLFDNDEDFFEACRGLSHLVGRRSITALLAKMYIDQLIVSRERAPRTSMPEDIPEMMLRYLDMLHIDASDDRKREVQEDAIEIAWLCLRERYTPVAVTVEEVLRALNRNGQAEARLAYLENNVRIIRREGPCHDQIRFDLDPLVEYLGGLKVVNMYKRHERHWHSFLKKANKRSTECANGFLLAVRDCCLSANSSVPAFVAEEIETRLVRSVDKGG